MKHISQYQDNTFYLAGVVERQVEREAWVDWARREEPVIPALAPVPMLTQTVKEAIMRGVSIIMP